MNNIPKVCVKCEKGVFFGGQIIEFLKSIGGKNGDGFACPRLGGNDEGSFYFVDRNGGIHLDPRDVPAGYRLITKREADEMMSGNRMSETSTDAPPHTAADEPGERIIDVQPTKTRFIYELSHDPEKLRKKQIRVYIASPYTKGDVAVNVRRSIDCWHDLTDKGFFPYCPLLTHFIHMVHPRPYQQWLDIDIHWMLECNCVLRLPGDSQGADAEVASALEHGMRVFYDVQEMLTFYAETCR